jgi:hypothetical protein
MPHRWIDPLGHWRLRDAARSAPALMGGIVTVATYPAKTPKTYVERAAASADAQRIRTFALNVTDRKVLAELQLMIEELERRAHSLTNGDATED